MLPFSDFAALLGIDLVLCTGLLSLLGRACDLMAATTAWKKWTVGFCFVALWLPMGDAHLPLLAYVRGISSDFSITLVVLACMDLRQRFVDRTVISRREKVSIYIVITAASIFLYPLALGLGNWDAYRLGWGTPAIWGALLVLTVLCWVLKFRWLPVLISLALLAWSFRLLESGNIWDYLLDPWLAVIAIYQCLKVGLQQALNRFSPGSRNSANLHA